MTPSHLVRSVPAPLDGVPLQRVSAGAAQAEGAETWVLDVDGRARWQVVVDWGDDAHVPFREQLVWSAAGVVVIGGGADVHLLDLATGAPRLRLAVPDRFGHLALVPFASDALLLVLGWTDARALDTSLTLRWHARNLAVDGLVFHRAEDRTLYLGAEMDPPGGWVDVALDLATGREIARSPSASEP